MTKLFASDFDGTLFFHDTNSFRPEDLEAIRRFRAEGGLFGLDTGRAFEAVVKQPEIRELPWDFVIASTGSSIFDREGACLWRKDVDKDAVRELYEGLAPYAMGPAYNFPVAADNYWTVGSRVDWPVLRYAATFDDIEGPFTGGGIETETIEIAQEAAAFVRERFAGVFDAFVNLASIDVVPAGCSKGAGLARAAELFGATLTGGIGDSFNDLPLIEAADFGYAFRWADAALHLSASALVETEAEALADFSRR